MGLSALYYLYSRTNTAGQAFGAGFFFAIGYFTTGLWWIGNALLVEGNEFAWVWPISVIGLPTLLALFTGTYLGCARIFSSPKTLRGFFLFCFFLLMSEWTRGHAFTGFPWNLYGYVWADHLPMAQMSYYIGAHGLTLVSILWASLAGFLIAARKPLRFNMVAVALVAFTMTVAYAGGQVRLANNPTKLDTSNGLVVVQPNIPQDMKWDPVAAQENFYKLMRLSQDAKFSSPRPKNVFVIWPETAISPSIYLVDENMDMIRNALESYKDYDSYVIGGVLRRLIVQDDVRYANSVVFLNKEMVAIQAYDKYHLVPFGEFIPFQNWIPLKPVAAFKGFERGKGAMTVERSGIPAFSPLICYEVIFPDQVTRHDGTPPKWIVNVTNDGWYGDSAGPYQHFAQTRLRAIEEGLPVVRAANTGISGVIDPLGRVLERADIFQEAAIVTYLPEPFAGARKYSLWLLQAFYPVITLILFCAYFPATKKRTSYSLE
jgi:apolipoprotein N-acyltransferase